MLLARFALACTIVLTASAQSASPPTDRSRIPIGHFFAQRVIQGATLSPDGTRVAFLGPVKTRLSVLLYDVATEKLEVAVHDPKEEIDFVAWKGDDTLLFGGDIGGNESMMFGSLNLKTRKLQRLAESRKSDFSLTTEAGLVDILDRDPEHILVLGTKANAGRNKKAAFDNADPGIYLLNVRNGTRKFLEPWDGATAAWIADNTGTVRLQVRKRGTHNELEHRQRPGDKWTTLYSHVDTDPAPWRPLRFAPDNRTLYVVTEVDAEGSMSLRTFDLGRQTLGAALFTSKHAEIADVIFERGTDKLLGVVTTKGTDTTHWLDPDRAKLAEKLKNTLARYPECGALLLCRRTSPLGPRVVRPESRHLLRAKSSHRQNGCALRRIARHRSRQDACDGAGDIYGA